MLDEAVGFHVRRVLIRTFGIYRDNFWSLMILSGIFGAPYFLVSLVIGLMDLPEPVRGDIDLIAGLIDGVLGVLAMGGITYGALRVFEGQRAGIDECFRASLTFGGRLIVLNIIYIVIVLLGFAALIIPGIYLLVVLCLVVPVMVAEGGSIKHAISTSAALTKGYRWHLFGLCMLVLIVPTMMVLAYSILVYFAGENVMPYGVSVVADATFFFITSVTFNVACSILFTVIYVDLRAIKGSTAPGSV